MFYSHFRVSKRNNAHPRVHIWQDYRIGPPPNKG